ncbi:furin-like [Sinocyclocheilus grahami]|uniref:furin-like n=1 Tax=Sinocyclocheilus grahami TaxID=75366 RepID=UPI0007AC8244|nr:PREDICTED: furin-like [Sinocyclocheilus grahami]
MDLRLVSLTLGTLLILVTSGPQPSVGQKVYTNTWAVHITGGEQEANRIARKHGFVNHGKVFGDFYHFRHRRVVKRSLSDHRGAHIRLHTEPQVMWAEQQVVKRRKKRDIYYELTDPKFAQQWYLYNEDHRDLNVKEAWKQGFTGQGVVVSILDDGIEKNHPDLIQNYDPDASYDVNDGDPDPQPRYTQLNDNRLNDNLQYNEDHRDLNVKEAWKQGFTGQGVVVSILDDGIEKNHPDLIQNYDPDASYDVNDGDPDPQPRYTQLNDNRRSFPNSTHHKYYPVVLSIVVGNPHVSDLAAQPSHLALGGRGGRGSIFVWASGNGGREKDSCNCDGYTNSIYTLSISSSTQNGNVPWYSEACSSTLATTYSSGSLNEKQIVTTDLRQKCTDSHTGTSASAPLAAGIIALALEANFIVVYPSVLEHYFLVFRNIGSHLVINKSVDACAGTDNFVSSLEHAQAQLTLSYNRRGNLAIYLISPQGTRSTLLAPRPHDYSSEGFSDWAFMTTHSWDEDPRGEWTLEIENMAGTSDYGTLTQFTLVLYGTASSLSGPSAADSSSCKTYDLNQICTECNPGFYLHNKGCVRDCPAGFTTGTRSIFLPNNEVTSVLRPACQSCDPICLTCSGTSPQNCLSCPPHSHLDPVSGTCLHQNHIHRESPDGGLFQMQGGGSSVKLHPELASRLPATVAVLSCAFIVAAFVAMFGFLQMHTHKQNKPLSAEAGPGSSLLVGFGFNRTAVAYKGIPSVWREDEGNSESENEEFEIRNERTGFIKTQSAL